MSERRFHIASIGLIHPSNISSGYSLDLRNIASVVAKKLPSIAAAFPGELLSVAFIYSTAKPRDPSGKSLVKASTSLVELQMDLYKASVWGLAIEHGLLGEVDVPSRFLFFDLCGASVGDTSSVTELESAVAKASSFSCCDKMCPSPNSCWRC